MNYLKERDSSTFAWEITPTEKRERNQKILILFLKLTPVVIGITFIGVAKAEVPLKESLYTIFYSILFFWAVILVALIVNKIFPFRKRTYLLDDQRITISKGKKKKVYQWNDFESFYELTFGYYEGKSSKYSDRYMAIHEDLKDVAKETKEIEGAAFYLRKKSSGLLSKLYKVFVVVYSEPDNSKAVSKFLDKHLSRRKRKARNDLGLIVYEFR